MTGLKVLNATQLAYFKSNYNNEYATRKEDNISLFHDVCKMEKLLPIIL